MWPHPSTRTAAMRVINSMSIITIHEKDIHITLTSPWVGRSCNLKFLFSFTYRCYIRNLVKKAHVILEKMFTTTDANPPQKDPLVRDSGNLKISSFR